ncbi:STAS domain-containing protein [Ornithinimicrobium sediminis]|uniref:STAS domain-containing protein n=1 Tax=Ornithinimicrobium sediminis TaxID=2904603 RepID=UPI001E43B19E|nr:STAS domain-containing protein [Ornithinimicrobium sediminis]MCE0485566.1 STAS domain-containing protein [Ornithinimicrobium sediminis]
MTATWGDLDIDVETPGVVRLRGALNVHTVPDLRVTLQRVLDTGEGDLVLHLGEAEVHDATGLGVLVGAHHRAVRRGRRLVIAETSERLERLLRLTKLHLVLARLDAPVAGTVAGGRTVRSLPTLPQVR